MESAIIARGAEAVLRKSSFLEKRAITKTREVKKYRTPSLDMRIRKERTRQEGMLLHKAKMARLRVPVVYRVQPGEGILEMEYINGKQLKEILDEDSLPLMEEAGKMIGKLHKAGLVHGDLTTSNFLVETPGLALVDFGMGFESRKKEDQAVDLLNFKKTYQATHYSHPEGWNVLLQAYQETHPAGKGVVQHIGKIEARARYS